ncbi:MAG TPA: T9SS type A sorting domain-containing protein [Candidatus Krumholzibacteria bacterium]|nr:T9SS type A sorting domain-containing protein [Candidatus Krumholzibacteria bacterium]
MHASVRRGRQGRIAARSATALLVLISLAATPAGAATKKIFVFGAKPLTRYDVKKNGSLVSRPIGTKHGTLAWMTDVSSTTRFDLSLGFAPTPVEGAPTPSAELSQNYPNPFNPSTRIPFSLGQAGPVLLRIFDVRGAHVVTVFDGSLNQGRHSLEWNGRDNHGQPVASGMYLYTLTTAGQTLSRKMVVLK